MATVELIASDADQDTYWEGVTYLDYKWLCNGAKNYKVRWTGSAYECTEIGTGGTKPPAFKVIRAWLGRLWGTGYASARRRVYYSEAGPAIANLESFGSSNYIELTAQGGNIASAELWERDMFVFLEHNIVSIPFALSYQDYREVDLGLGWGCVAPYSLRCCGPHGLVCVSDGGVREFPSQRILSGLIDRTFQNLSAGMKRGCYGRYDDRNDTYNLWVCTATPYQDGGAYFVGHDQWWVYDFKRGIWYKNEWLPYRGIADVFNYRDGRRMLVGTYKGRTFRHDYGALASWSLTTVYSGTIKTVDSSVAWTQADADTDFPTTGNALKQIPVRIVSGTGVGQERVIASNTATQITVETAWSPACAVGDGYIVGAIKGRLKSPFLNMREPQRNKRFFELRLAGIDLTDKYYELVIYADYDETTPLDTIRGQFEGNNPVIPLDASGKAVCLDLSIFSATGRPEIKSMKLIWEMQRY